MVKEIEALCQDKSLVSEAFNSKRSLPADFANRAVEIIQTKIKDYKAPDSGLANKSSMQQEMKVYSFFKKLLSSPKGSEFPGCGHCEAILMAIIHHISNKDDLDFSLKACSP